MDQPTKLSARLGESDCWLQGDYEGEAWHRQMWHEIAVDAARMDIHQIYVDQQRSGIDWKTEQSLIKLRREINKILASGITTRNPKEK